MRCISCKFLDSDKAYTYKSEDSSIKVGNLVIVENTKPSNRTITINGVAKKLNMLSILEVVAVDVPMDPNIRYKYIIDKIDFTSYMSADKLGEA